MFCKDKVFISFKQIFCKKLLIKCDLLGMRVVEKKPTETGNKQIRLLNEHFSEKSRDKTAALKILLVGFDSTCGVRNTPRRPFSFSPQHREDFQKASFWRLFVVTFQQKKPLLCIYIYRLYTRWTNITNQKIKAPNFDGILIGKMENLSHIYFGKMLVKEFTIWVFSLQWGSFELWLLHLSPPHRVPTDELPPCWVLLCHYLWWSDGGWRWF